MKTHIASTLFEGKTECGRDLKTKKGVLRHYKRHQVTDVELEEREDTCYWCVRTYNSRQKGGKRLVQMASPHLRHTEDG